MDVNMYIGFWTLEVKCTQYELYEQATFKNARVILFFRSRAERAVVFSGIWNSRFVLWGLHGGVESWGPALIHLPPKVHRGRFSVHPVYIMDHEVTPRPYKIYDWLLNSSWDQFGLHQGEIVRVTMKFEVPKRYVQRPTFSTNMVQRVLRWERQKRCSSRKRQGPMA